MSHSRNHLKARAIATFSSKGNRPGQEDFLLVDREKGIFIIADGFGGPIPGAQASKLACEVIRSFLFKEAGDLEATLPFVLRNYFSLAGNVLFNALIFANKKLANSNHGKNVHERGGASVLAGFIDGDLLALANVGTCDAWLLRDGKLVELVVPRTFGRLCDPFASPDLGKGSSDELCAPLIALGMASDLEPEIFEYRLKKGDWVILTTDGIHARVRDEIAEIHKKGMQSESSIKEVNEMLEKQAFQDNASVSIIIV
jgi:protein phosphatase